MKLVKEEKTGTCTTLLHLFDLPLLRVRGKWTESMQQALMEQYGIRDPYEITQQDAFKTLKVRHYPDQKTIQEEKDIIDCYQVSGELFGRILHEEKKALAEKLIHEKWNHIESSQEDIIRHAQISNTIDIITQFYIQECQSRFQDTVPEPHQNLSFRHVLIKTLKK